MSSELSWWQFKQLDAFCLHNALYYSPRDMSFQSECLEKWQYFSLHIKPESSRHLGDTHQVLLQFIKKKYINVDLKLNPRHWRALGMEIQGNGRQ